MNRHTSTAQPSWSTAEPRRRMSRRNNAVRTPTWCPASPALRSRWGAGRGGAGRRAVAADAWARARRLRWLGRKGLGRSGDAAVGNSMERHPNRRRGVGDSVEGPIVGDDFQDVAGLGMPEPTARRDRDPEIAPVAYTDRRRAVHEL